MDASNRQPDNPGAKVYAEPSSGNGDGRPHSHPSPRETVSQMARLIAEYREYLSHFLSAKIDSMRFTLRKGILYAVAGMVALIAATTTIVMAVVLLLLGAARGLGSVFGNGLGWLGDLIIGLLVLTGIGLIVYAAIRWATASFRKNMVEKYEQRQDWQRRQFGRAAAEQAAASHAQHT